MRSITTSHTKQTIFFYVSTIGLRVHRVLGVLSEERSTSKEFVKGSFPHNGCIGISLGGLNIVGRPRSYYYVYFGIKD